MGRDLSRKEFLSRTALLAADASDETRVIGAGSTARVAVICGPIVRPSANAPTMPSMTVDVLANMCVTF